MSNLLRQIKDRIDIHEAAIRLGLQRPHPTGNYRSPHHVDKNPSVSIFVREGVGYYKDHSTGRGGDVIDLVQDMGGMDFEGAVEWLCSQFGIIRPSVAPQPAAELSKAEWIAQRCRANTDRAIDYLAGRGIPEEISRGAIQHGALGFNDWTSAKTPPGTFGYGGPAVAFIIRSINPGKIMAVDMRYLDPALNGGVKTQTQGEKGGNPWFSHFPTIKQSQTVYIVESPINALSVQTAGLKNTAALATRGVATVDSIDWRFLAGKRVVICMDADKPQADGRRPGPEAAWRLHGILTDLGIAAFLVDQEQWEHNDINDILQHSGPQKLRMILETLEPWAIPGLPGNVSRSGRTRIFLPSHDYDVYQRYRVKEDFTIIWKDEFNKETGERQDTPIDLAGFRLVAIDKIQVASPESTYAGVKDKAPIDLFAITVQTPASGTTLIRRAFNQDDLFKLEKWLKFGHVWNLGAFMRLVTIFSRVANQQTKQAINFVGVAWKDGKLVVNEGKDCYFTEPSKQCFYRNLEFSSGTVQDARKIISAYQQTFRKNAGLLTLVWVLGAHLKVILGYWPHCILEAEKATGKTTFTKQLQYTTGMVILSGQSINTEYRIITSIGYSSQPIGWDEFSARDQKRIDSAVGILQELYQFASFTRGQSDTLHLNSAPVLIAGESIQDEAHSILGKVVRIDLVEQGDILPDGLPAFPMRQWLEFLTTLTKARVKELHAESVEICIRSCRSDPNDKSARRIIENYAALLCAWRLICEFSGISDTMGGLPEDLIAAMNSYLSETKADRQPWVWVMEIILNEIAAGNFKHPYEFDELEHSEKCLIIKCQHIMHHIRTAPGLRDFWNALPIKSARIFKKQMNSAGIIWKDRVDITFNGHREFHLQGLSLANLEQYGLFASKPHDRI